MGGIYSPQKESACWGVRDPDMSGLESGHVRQQSLEPNLRTGHVRQQSLEPNLRTGHVRCLALSRVKAEEPDMSAPGTGYVWEMLL
jgi:hypothetical protein